MRIIAGKYKGKRIDMPRSVKARPTTDIAKEGLFNVLANYCDFQDMKVLDLYAGTGSIGMEFLSRGAASVVMVEYDRFHVTAILHNIQKLGIDNVWVKNADAVRYCRKAPEQFDIVFADPPFTSGTIADLPDVVLQPTLLKEGGLFILEHSMQNAFSQHPDFLYSRRYGSVCFSFFLKKG